MPAGKDDHDAVWRAFHDAVNMDAGRDRGVARHRARARKVGFKRDRRAKASATPRGGGSCAILRADRAELDGGDYAHMRKVVGFVERHRAQGPHDEYRIPTSRWRYSLMNWGHDPLRD